MKLNPAMPQRSSSITIQLLPCQSTSTLSRMAGSRSRTTSSLHQATMPLSSESLLVPTPTLMLMPTPQSSPPTTTAMLSSTSASTLCLTSCTTIALQSRAVLLSSTRTSSSLSSSALSSASLITPLSFSVRALSAECAHTRTSLPLASREKSLSQRPPPLMRLLPEQLARRFSTDCGCLLPERAREKENETTIYN